ncbi:MAG: hypothetical protein FJ267_04300 [Planctomycetes bacterium]|nr:hypothetical protein [Planctomycetota bacterium]
MPTRQSRIERIVSNLEIVILSGPWTVDAISSRLTTACGKKAIPSWIRPFTINLISTFASIPGLIEIREQIDQDDQVKSWIKTQKSVRKLRITGLPRVMLPLKEMFRSISLPEILSPNELAQWMELSNDELDWFADTHSWERNRDREGSRHYRYRWLRRANRAPRLLEIPKSGLRSIQRRILHEILDPSSSTRISCVARIGQFDRIPSRLSFNGADEKGKRNVQSLR